MLEESITWFKKGCTLECWWRSWIWFPVSKIWILVLILNWIFFQRKSWFVKLSSFREPIYFWTLEPTVTGPEAPGGSARSQDRGPRGRKTRPEDWGHWTLGTAYDWHDGGPSQPHDLHCYNDFPDIFLVFEMPVTPEFFFAFCGEWAVTPAVSFPYMYRFNVYIHLFLACMLSTRITRSPFLCTGSLLRSSWVFQKLSADKWR